MGCAEGWMAQGQEDLSLRFVTPLLNSQLAELFHRWSSPGCGDRDTETTPDTLG